MPLDISIRSDPPLVLSRGGGEITEEEALDHQHRLAANPDFEPAGRQLMDVSQATNILISADGVGRLVQGDPWAPGARQAFVASEDLPFGILRMHELLMENGDQQIMVFRTRPEALRWLELDERLT